MFFTYKRLHGYKYLHSIDTPILHIFRGGRSANEFRYSLIR
jgi:hypothetical protein